MSDTLNTMIFPSVALYSDDPLLSFPLIFHACGTLPSNFGFDVDGHKLVWIDDLYSRLIFRLVLKFFSSCCSFRTLKIGFPCCTRFTIDKLGGSSLELQTFSFLFFAVRQMAVFSP